MEIYKSYNENYEVSNLGNIRNKKTLRVLKTWETGIGYRKVQVGSGRLRKRVHRLVAELFCEKPLNIKVEVHHINHIRHDNRSCNLRWVTHQDNCLMKIIHN